jgi:glycosyltransferase involved in cell wall biosynthesis
MNPTISVVMTAFNHQDYIEEAIASVLEQSFADLELIIVDDASSDQTGSKIAKFIDSRIISLRNRKNLGTTKSLNKGIKAAKGDYIAIMCSDDWLPIDSLKHRYYAIKKYKADICHGGLLRVDLNQQTSSYISPLSSTKKILSFFAKKPINVGINTVSFLFHRKVFEQIGSFSKSDKTKYNRDYEFSLRVMYHYYCVSINKNVYNYRIHKTNNSHHNWMTKQSKKNFAYIENKYQQLFLQKFSQKAQRFNNEIIPQVLETV